MKTYNKPEFKYIDLELIDILNISGDAEDFGDFDYGSLGGKS